MLKFLRRPSSFVFLRSFLQFLRSFSEKMRDSSFSWKSRSLDESESDLEEELLSQRHGGTKRMNIIRQENTDLRKFLGYESTGRSATD